MASVPLITKMGSFSLWKQSLQITMKLMTMHLGTFIVYVIMALMPPSPDPNWLYPLRNLEWLFSVPLIIRILGRLSCVADRIEDEDENNDRSRKLKDPFSKQIPLDREETISVATMKKPIMSGEKAASESKFIQYTEDCALWHAMSIALGVNGIFGPLTFTPLGNALTIVSCLSLYAGWVLLRNFLMAVVVEQVKKNKNKQGNIGLAWFLNFTPIFIGVIWCCYGAARMLRVLYSGLEEEEYVGERSLDD